MQRIYNIYCKDDIKRMWMMMYIIMERQKPYGYIYKIDFPNDKAYIGLTTTSLKIRQSQHKGCAKRNINRPLYKALKSFKMEDTFELIEIDTADTKEELCEKEILYIQMYNSFDKEYGYNMTLGGEGSNGYVYTQEQKQNLSEVVRQYHLDNPDAGTEHSERMKKYYEDNPEAREKLSEVGKKYWENPEVRKEQSERLKTHFENPGTREKQSEALKKYYEDNPGAREKNSEALKKYYKDNPGAREKNSEAIKKYYQDNPGAREKNSDSRGKNKPFDVFAKDGTFVGTFKYQFKVIEYIKNVLNKRIHATNITKVLKGRLKSTAGLKFIYKDDIPSTSES